MISVLIDYATPSVLESTRDSTVVGLTANRRRPVRFHGRVARHTFMVRVALRALGEAIWSDSTWRKDMDYLFSTLDPVITVHPDRVFFEAFSQDQSVYVSVRVDPEVFETEGTTSYGTTNVDFAAWLWAALAEMRTGRQTWLRVEPGGFEVKTMGAGGRFEQTVDVPESWVRGFLQTCSAMALPGTRLTVRPVDLLSAVRFLRYAKAKVSPRALRFEMEPGSDARIVLEPWERVVPLRGAEHGYTDLRVIRTWGRNRLRLIEPLLPFADSVEIYLKGRALPSFYVVNMPGVSFTLGLTGWTEQRWTGSGSFDLLLLPAGDSARLNDVLTELAKRITARPEDVAAALDIPKEDASRLLARLCRRGQAIYDVQRRDFRHRELFEVPPDEGLLYPPDERVEKCREILGAGKVHLESCTAQENRKGCRYSSPVDATPVLREVIHRDWAVSGAVDGMAPVELVLSDEGRIIFGRCRCPFFDENLLNRGPCAHMLALLVTSEPSRKDLPTSREAPGGTARRPSRPRSPDASESAQDGSRSRPVESDEG